MAIGAFEGDNQAVANGFNLWDSISNRIHNRENQMANRQLEVNKLKDNWALQQAKTKDNILTAATQHGGVLGLTGADQALGSMKYNSFEPNSKTPNLYERGQQDVSKNFGVQNNPYWRSMQPKGQYQKNPIKRLVY